MKKTQFKMLAMAEQKGQLVTLQALVFGFYFEMETGEGSKAREEKAAESSKAVLGEAINWGQDSAIWVLQPIVT